MDQENKTPEQTSRERLGAFAGEHFKDYAIMVRDKEGFWCWSSDRTWATGAIERFRTELDEAFRREFNRLQDQVEDDE